MSTDTHYIYTPGTVPVLVNMPHTATAVPDDIFARLTPEAQKLPDTDWHIHTLYECMAELGVHRLQPIYSRYVVDLNRAPTNESLYPGQFTTGTCPTTLFDGSPLYREGQEPDDQEIEQRVHNYWQPYHLKLRATIDALHKQYGRVVLFDAHSICSEVPTLFDGMLPDLNIGTDNGKTADKKLCDAVFECAQKSGYSAVYNGRFKGGYITRHYGKPELGIHTIQLELAQKNYMNEAYPFDYDLAKAADLQRVLHQMMTVIIDYISTT